MSRDLQEIVASELIKLRLLTQNHLTFFNFSEDYVPPLVQRSACAVSLHSFYTGIERIFVNIAKHSGQKQIKGYEYHAQLLNSMQSTSTERPRVISDELKEKLKDYLGFRHRFRHSYDFELEWSQMRGLVIELNGTFGQFERDQCVPGFS